MKLVPVIPENAPFTAEQRAWLNGYLAGLFSHVPVAATEAAPEKPLKPLLVLYGSQTGTAEQLAKRIAKDSKAIGFNARVTELNACPPANLAIEERIVIVTSTWGDGDPPDNAAQFWTQLNAADAPRLPQLSYAVLALGDRNYSDFCGAGKKFDTRLEQLGAKRLIDRAECDTDYETTAKTWIEGLWSKLNGASSINAPSAVSQPEPAKKKTFEARLISCRNLNLPGSAKETRHVEISLKDLGLAYEVGDALGIAPANCPELVAEILAALKCDGEEAVKSPQGEELPLRKALLSSYQITQIPPPLLNEFATRSKNSDLKTLLDPTHKADLDRFLYGREIIDLFFTYPHVSFAPAEFVTFLRKLQPRLYSISSSPKAHPEEVHLTVGAVRYESYGRKRKGVCSTFLADRVCNETPLPVFVQTSNGFRLPIDTAKPIIMIGPGTGLAPFRAFLEERRAIGAKGKNWLFFGDQSAATDFLYRQQIESMQSEGTLTRLDTAFSRDQADKIYVQHRIEQNASDLWSWLEDGAHVYVCGDAKRMAKDVETSLLKVIEKAGGRSTEQAGEYLQKLKTEKRYQRDVY